MSLRIYNTLSRALEEFSPLEPGHVRMYVCGMTVYDLCHVGHARANVAFDVVQRWLKASGYQTAPFYALAALRSAMALRRYDGYVLDWIVGDETVRELISQIRADCPLTPILVLTGQVGSGRVNESSVATALATYGLLYFEKPVRLAIISAALAQGLAKTRQKMA